MPDSFQAFAKRLEFKAKGITDQVEKAVRRAAIAADTVAVMSTPVETGRARGNWVTSVGTLRNKVDDQHYDKNGQATIAKSSSEIAAWDLLKGTIYISNGVSYIFLLDSGTHSRKAPQGMTKLAVQAAQAQLRIAGLVR